jgi:hypothetical protein
MGANTGSCGGRSPTPRTPVFKRASATCTSSSRDRIFNRSSRGWRPSSALREEGPPLFLRTNKAAASASALLLARKLFPQPLDLLLLRSRALPGTSPQTLARCFRDIRVEAVELGAFLRREGLHDADVDAADLISIVLPTRPGLPRLLCHLRCPRCRWRRSGLPLEAESSCCSALRSGDPSR